MTEPKLLSLSRELLAIAQTGLAYTNNPYDAQRYERLRELAAAFLAPSLSLEPSFLIDLHKREQGYATPKISTRAAVFKDDRILLVREAADGRWSLPGGWTDINQSPVECAVREVWEESGYTVRCTKLAAVLDHRTPERPQYFHHYNLFFLCELTGGAAKTSIETEAIDFFAHDNLPELSLYRTTEQDIARMFDHYRNPGLPTDFD
jgi:ADP-ribose pyrophosphatase YjhB (NUDIX family)